MALSRADELLDDVGLARIDITEAVIRADRAIEVARKALDAMERQIRVVDRAAGEQMVGVHELRGLRAEVTRTRTTRWDESKPDRRRTPVYRDEAEGAAA